MSVLSREFDASASIEHVRDLLTTLPKLSEYTEVRGITGDAPEEFAVGTTWKNSGVTMGMPTSDISTVIELSETLIAWTTWSKLLGLIPTQMYWSYTLESKDDGTRVINTLERVYMMGVPIGILVKLPFLPFLYLARGTMMASERKLVRTLS